MNLNFGLPLNYEYWLNFLLSNDWGLSVQQQESQMLDSNTLGMGGVGHKQWFLSYFLNKMLFHIFASEATTGFPEIAEAHWNKAQQFKHFESSLFSC